jgi:hypothetical protein
LKKNWLPGVTRSYQGLPQVTRSYQLPSPKFEARSSKQIRNSNAKEPQHMNVINRIGLIFLIDFFETSIDEGYDRECHIGKSTDGRSLRG